MGFFQQKLPSYLMLWQLAIYLRLNQKNTPIAKMIVTMLIRAITCGFANKPKLDNFPIDSISLSLPKTFIKRSFSAFRLRIVLLYLRAFVWFLHCINCRCRQCKV